MLTIIFHTILYILSIIILAALAVIMLCVACVAVKMVFISSTDEEQPNK